jgi:ABC-type multidrug transport system fused ATPase/permease subunit
MTAPLRGLLVKAIVMVVLAATISLALPYLTKVAIDGYILPLARVFKMRSPGELSPQMRGRLEPSMFVFSGQPELWFLPKGPSDLIDRRQEKLLIEASILDESRYYLAQVGDGGLSQERVQEIKAALPQTQVLPQYLAILENDLPSVPGAAVMALRGADVRGLAKLAIWFAVLMVLGYVFDLGQRYYLEAGAQKLGHTLRIDLLAHLFSLRQSFFDRTQTARLTSRLTSDINNINALVKSTAASFFSDFLSLAGVIVIMFTLSPKLAATALVLTPLAAILSYRFSLVARYLQRDLRAKVAAINHSFGEQAAGIGVIQAFRREKKTSEEFEDLNHQNYLTGFKQLHSVAVFLPLVDLCSTVVLALILWVGGLGVIDNTVSLGVLAAFVGYTNRFFNPIKDLAEKVNTFQGAFASLERLVGLLELHETLPHPAVPLAPVRPGGAMEFKNVCLRYGPDMPQVLTDISFKVERGETVALVGSTGSGKSSLINLMLRFYDPVSGSVIFDGIDLTDLDLKLHRRRVGLVTQDVYLYSAPVIDNLRLGRIDLPAETVIQAAKAVGAHYFIEKLPMGYDEPLGPGGRGLSAGQRQLIACARALIEAPELVILDEATAFVDSETELLIEQAMTTVFKGRTSVVIAHRLSTIRRVDRIMVLDRGRLVENGTHRSLMDKKGIYYHLASLQGLS